MNHYFLYYVLFLIAFGFNGLQVFIEIYLKALWDVVGGDGGSFVRKLLLHSMWGVGGSTKSCMYVPGERGVQKPVLS